MPTLMGRRSPVIRGIDASYLTSLPDYWGEIQITHLAETKSGTGSTSVALEDVDTATGTTASSTALRKAGFYFTHQGATGPTVFNFSKPCIWMARFTMNAGTSTGTSVITFGKVAEGTAILANRGFGIEVDNLALKGVVHNGTSLATVDLSDPVTRNEQRITSSYEREDHRLRLSEGP